MNNNTLIEKIITALLLLLQLLQKALEREKTTKPEKTVDDQHATLISIEELLNRI